jgi:hypothetical protein
MVTKYRPIVDLCEELFGVRPSHATVSRYAHHKRGGKRLHVVKAGGRLLTTEEDLISYLTVRDEQETDANEERPLTQKAIAKAQRQAEMELDREGI